MRASGSFSILKNKIQQIFKLGVVTNIIKDVGNYPKTQVKTRGDKVQNAAVMHDYGFHSVAPIDGQAYVFSVNGDEGNFAVITDAPNLRPKNLKEGETIAGNWIEQSWVYFKEDGSIEIKSNGKPINITTSGASQVNVNGCEFLPSGIAKIPVLQVGTMTSISGNPITTDVDIISGTTSLQNHVHGGVTPGSGNTSPPTA